MFRNEKGSIPIAIIVAVASAFTVLLLSNLLISENAANEKYNKKVQNEVYQLKSVLETTNNLVLQKLNEDETQYYSSGTFFPIVNSDITEIENALNTSVLPYFFGNTTVHFSNLKYNKSLDMLCNDVVEENPYTFQQEIVGVNCEATYFYLSFDLDVNTPRGLRQMNVKFDKLYPKESEKSGFIKVNYENLEIDVTSL